MQPKPGDTVRIETNKETVEGILLPEPELVKSDAFIVKLKSGYNIGIDKDKVRNIQVVQQYKPLQERKEGISYNKKLPMVSLLSTGGTISSKIDYRTGGVYADYTAEDFVEMLPELAQVANIKAEKIMGEMSEDFNAHTWKIIAERAAKELNSDAKGIIITQGTDTLHFTTAVLSFMLGTLNKPVVFTASQRSIDRGSSDALMNLLCSTIAASRFDGAEVVTCMHATSSDDYCILNRGTKVRKMHTSRRDAFRPINELPLAEVYGDGKIQVLNAEYRKRQDITVQADTAFEEKTALVYVYPGFNPEVLDFYLDKGYKGIVLAATALGHVATLHRPYSLMPQLERAKQEHVPVVIASQTIYGSVHPFVYTNLRKLSMKEDCIFAGDMLAETAYIKLGWVLGHTTEPKEAGKLMLTNMAGEMSDRMDATSFLY